MENNAQPTQLVLNCITFLTDSDTIKNCWYWPGTDTDTRYQCSSRINYNFAPPPLIASYASVI